MSDAPGFERSDVAPRWVVLVIAGLLGIVLVFFCVVALILYGLTPAEKPVSSSLSTQQARSGWRLEVNPADDEIRFQHALQPKLDSYAWADRGAGRVQIPIDRAMQILANQGWPDPPSQEGGK